MPFVTALADDLTVQPPDAWQPLIEELGRRPTLAPAMGSLPGIWKEARVRRGLGEKALGFLPFLPPPRDLEEESDIMFQVSLLGGQTRGDNR